MARYRVRGLRLYRKKVPGHILKNGNREERDIKEPP